MPRPAPPAERCCLGYLRHRTAYARTPEPRSKAAAGKTTDGATDTPPLWGSAVGCVCSIIGCCCC